MYSYAYDKMGPVSEICMPCRVVSRVAWYRAMSSDMSFPANLADSLLLASISGLTGKN